MDPSFDLRQLLDGATGDLLVGPQDFMDCLVIYGITSAGKDFVAFLQETDDVIPLGDWCCRISRRDFDAYGFDLATDRGLVLCSYQKAGETIRYGVITRAA